MRKSGVTQFAQWLMGCIDIILSVNKVNVIIHITQAYNGSLYINSNIRTKDAVSKLEAFLTEQIQKEDGFDETDTFLVDLLKSELYKRNRTKKQIAFPTLTQVQFFS